ncbi:SGNH/GDSL hydrolase family protein [Nocardia sp. NPDC003693]
MSGNSGRWLCAAVLAASTALTTSPGANAEPAPDGKPIVVLGDSFTANVWDPLSTNECLRGPTAWPAQLTGKLGARGAEQVADISCLGASIDTPPGHTLTHETRAAATAGAFGPATKLVTLQFGLNDRWGGSQQSLWDAMRACVFDLAGGCGAEAVAEGRMPDAQAITGAAFADRVRNAVTYIRYYAPAARIVLVGYPELFREEQETVCLEFFGVVPFVQPRGRTIVEYLERMDLAQRDAAEALNVEFFDTRAVTTGHGLCSDDPWVNGVFDPTVKFDGLPFHPSPTGDAVVANALYERYVR